jgi:basic membrane protein A
VDVDGYFLLEDARDVLLTSILKNMDNSVYDVIESAMTDEFDGCGVYVGDLANAGVGIAPYHDLADMVPADLAAEIDALAAQIIDGTITDTGCISYPDWCPGGLY